MAKKTTFPATIYVAIEHAGTEDQYLLASESQEGVGLELTDRKRVGVYKLDHFVDLVSKVDVFPIKE